jgi:hypothetical protein
MKYLLLTLFFFSTLAQARITGFQDADAKTHTDFVNLGIPDSNFLNLNHIWDEVNGQLLSATIAASGGSAGLVVSSVSSNTTLAVGSPVNQQHIACDATSGSVLLTVPLCAGHIGQYFNVKKIDSSINACDLVFSGSDVADGNSSISMSYQYDDFTIVCRAAGFWDIL